MCETCGCGAEGEARLMRRGSGKWVPVSPRNVLHHHHGESEPHSHSHEQGQEHEHPDGHSSVGLSRTVAVEGAVLAKNDSIAAHNRAWFAGREVLAVNLMSSPGAGKTTLLERTIRDLKNERALYVIEGDQATTADAQRIHAAGAAAVQVNTGSGCHLDAQMVAHAADALQLAPRSLLMIENVGNLVCPALFDLGERAKVVIFSVTEGDDKPLKYPYMFSAAQVMILNKIDLLTHVDFDEPRCIGYAREINPGLKVLRVSARTGEGMSAWYEWLRQEAAAVHARQPDS